MSTVLTAVFKDYDAAQRVRVTLIQDGFPTDRVELTALRDLGRAAFQPGETPHHKMAQYFRSLWAGRDSTEDYPEKLAQHLEEGGAAVTVLPRGAIETARATNIVRHAQPEDVVGYDLENHGWERAAARHDSAWAQHVWFEHSADDAHCIYCRMFSHAEQVLQAAPIGLPASVAFDMPVRQPRVALSEPIKVHRVHPLQSLTWLRKGWDDLWQLRASSLMYGVLIATFGAVLLILGSSHPYFVAAAVSGYLLVGPIMTTGCCELSRRRAAGEPVGFDESLEAVSLNRHELFKFGALLAAIAIVWFVASEVMLRSIFHSVEPTVAETLWGGFTETANRMQIIAYIGSGAVLASLVFTLSVVAVPLIIDRNVRVTDAIWTSIKATFWNLPAMTVWSTLIVALTALGFVSFLVGMVLVAPLLGHATWHAYRDLVH